jgi:hypothetical protein
MPNGEVWRAHCDPVTKLYTVTIETAEGEITTRMTMTRDDLLRFRNTVSSILESFRAGTPEPGMVVTEDMIVFLEIEK